MSEGDLHEYEVTITMVRNRLGVRTLRDFTLVVPAVDEDEAKRSGIELGYAVNTASGHVWKRVGDVDDVRVRLTEPKSWTLTAPPGSEVKRLRIKGEDGFVLEIAAQATGDREQLWNLFRVEGWVLINTIPWSHVIARFGEVTEEVA